MFYSHVLHPIDIDRNTAKKVLNSPSFFVASGATSRHIQKSLDFFSILYLNVHGRKNPEYCFFEGAIMKITRKPNKGLFFRVFSVVLIFGLLFIGCGEYKPDIGEWIDEHLEKAPETEDVPANPEPSPEPSPEPTIDAVAEVNKAAGPPEIKSALETYAEELELDLTLYGMLSDDIKDTTAQSVHASKPYADKEAIQTAFNDVLQAAATAQKNLSLKFKITPEDSSDKAAVEASFNAVHNYIQKSFTVNTTLAQSIIKLDDYINLPSLTVAGDASVEAIDKTNVRLIVIGINSFNGKNGNNTPHVVFHFEDAPGKHKMNETNDNTTGYLGSAMREYIVNNFLTGLKNAGVPDEVLWPPSRCVASRGDGTPPTPQTVKDDLWLPTAWEMTGEQIVSFETSSNQVSFAEHYESDTARKKNGEWYWLASPYADSGLYFCGVNGYGSPAIYNASQVGGCAPAFCVK
ncbi:MAG: hypothetical protein Ta2F_10060 [Termitinemataceae bacterium]|nr:MAG: hypothetical protein Ta2F_10060 [Termitinemataceae bacterium]